MRTQKQKIAGLLEVGRKASLSKNIGAAKKRKMKTFKDDKGTEKAAVTKEDMQKAGFKSFGKESLRRYLNGLGPKKGDDLLGDFSSQGLTPPSDRPRKKKVVKKKSRTIFGVGGAKKGGKVSDGVKFVARQYGGKIGN